MKHIKLLSYNYYSVFFYITLMHSLTVQGMDKIPQLTKRQLFYAIEMANMKSLAQCHDPLVHLDILANLKKLRENLEEDMKNGINVNREAILQETIKIETRIFTVFNRRKDSESFASGIYLPPMPGDIDDELNHYEKLLNNYLNESQHTPNSYYEFANNVTHLLNNIINFFSGRGCYIGADTKSSLLKRCHQLHDYAVSNYVQFQLKEIHHEAERIGNYPLPQSLIMARQLNEKFTRLLHINDGIYVSEEQKSVLADLLNRTISALQARQYQIDMKNARSLLALLMTKMNQLQAQQSTIKPQRGIRMAQEMLGELEYLAPYAPLYDEQEKQTIKQFYKDIFTITNQAKGRLPTKMQ